MDWSESYPKNMFLFKQLIKDYKGIYNWFLRAACCIGFKGVGVGL